MVGSLALAGCATSRTTTTVVVKPNSRRAADNPSSLSRTLRRTHLHEIGREDESRPAASPSPHASGSPVSAPLLSDAQANAVIRDAPPGSGFIVAPLSEGPVAERDPPVTPHAWSTIKPVIVAAVLEARRAGLLGSPDTPTSTETELIARAIENSDNEAAAALFAELGDQQQATKYLQQVLDKAGDHSTTVNERVTRPGLSSYGQTSWPLTDEATFYRALANGCLLGSADTSAILNDMRGVTDVGEGSWGLPAAGFSDLAFKAGWGPEEGDGAYTALQFGIVGSAQEGGYVVGIVVESDGDSATAFSDASALAQSLANVLGQNVPAPGTPAC